MKIVVLSGCIFLAVVSCGVIGILVVGCRLHRPAPHAQAEQVSQDSGVVDTYERQTALYAASVTRVGGDAHALTEFVGDEFRSGGCRIPTPLPEGYPPPTPPGAIELKHYPLVRRAEIRGTMSPDWGMNFAFFPLFNHIKRREIAMTSPVEVDYVGLDSPARRSPDSWTMSFLYRTPDLGPDGIDPKDDRVLIEDIPPVTVVAIGMRGPYKLSRVKRGVNELRGWLSSQTEWEEAGLPRALFYNGPEARSGEKWSEVQIPIRRR